MRVIEFDELVDKVKQLVIDANCYLPDDVMNAIKTAYEEEESPIGREILAQIIENNEIARRERLPICQDTGFAVFFVELGSEIYIKGGTLEQALEEGTRRGYKEGYLRKSIVDDPVINRKNTGDNTPIATHIHIVTGDKLKITFMPKGGGAENMAEVAMLSPAEGIEGVKRFVIERVKRSGGRPCPPVIVGVGIGGTFDYVAYLAKRALLRRIGEHHPDDRFAQLERDLLDEINQLGIGPMGLGGRVTALAVHVETYPCHIATMPVAVNLNCHAARHKTIVI
ncbi:fumarate hydratase [candidate division WOR-3 bacterium]|nr:fumarate hydratase [candidate division WOR-3 bacterium]